ncbi:MAG: Tn3 family transposase [Hyphomicrobium sp.]
MTTIDRTAYPRFRRRYSADELRADFSLLHPDHRFIGKTARGRSGRLTLATMLVCRRRFGWFPRLRRIPSQVVIHMAGQLGLKDPTSLLNETKRKKTLAYYRDAIRAHIGGKAFDEASVRHVASILRTAAETMSDPADLINRMIEALRDLDVDLPAFSRLDRIAGSVRVTVHRHLFASVADAIPEEAVSALDKLLVVPPAERTTPFNRLKQSPGPARLSNLRAWSERLDWLESLPVSTAILNDIKPSKRRQFADEASRMEVSEFLDLRETGKRHTLLMCSIEQVRARCRDEMIEMFLRRVRRTQTAARDKLAALHDKNQAIEEGLIGILFRTLTADKEEVADQAFGARVRTLFSQNGGVDTLVGQCETVSAWHSNNYLPLLWSIHKQHRAAIFRLLELMDLRSATQDQTLIKAWRIVVKHRNARRDELDDSIDLSFLSERWRNFVEKRRNCVVVLDRRRFEVCMMIHLAHALECGDIFVVGSEEFADYRTQLLSWDQCQTKLDAYCVAVNLPATSADFVTSLQTRLRDVAGRADASFPDNTDLSIDADGIPHLKRMPGSPSINGFAEFERHLTARIPERQLLDVLKNVEHWTGYTRHFGPPSGADPKLANAVRRYLFTIFGYGCNLGPAQTARHAPNLVTRQALRRINASHITSEKLEAATVDIVNAYTRFSLPKLWGAGMTAIADGTHIPLRENNLIGSRHIRYGGYGGISYNHIADTYIALFTTFIPCGVWEAVYILDGLLKNRAEVQPDTLHADTHGQNEAVFGLCYLLGIKLMPRMRTWSEVAFYRPNRGARYRHIGSLFTRDINWDLIEAHWADLMQVAISIQAGVVTPSMLLRRLGSQNRKNRLYRALRELGRVERTLFLLRYISDPDMRRTIRAETTKIESFNDFLDWISFGGPVVKSGDPVEHEKQVKYASLVANAIMLSNVVDLTDALSQMAEDEITVAPELAAGVSPYLREHIRRFGWFSLDMDDLPKPLEPKPLPFGLPL